MASDLLSRLRAICDDDAEITTSELVRYAATMDEAADTIERYEAALRAVFDNSTDKVAVEAARAALRSQDKGEG